MAIDSTIVVTCIGYIHDFLKGYQHVCADFFYYFVELKWPLELGWNDSVPMQGTVQFDPVLAMLSQKSSLCIKGEI